MQTLFDVVDISASQKIIDANLLKSKVGGVIIKLGYTGYESNKPAKSKTFDEQYKVCREHGIPVGVYYFTLAHTPAMVEMETSWVLNQIKDLELELPVYVDCEMQDNSPGWTALSFAQRDTYMNMWCSMIQNAGYYAGIYLPKVWGPAMPNVKPFDHWIAQYNTVCTYSGSYGMWQYTSRAIPTDYGIVASGLDVSHCYINYPELIRARGLNHLVPTHSDNSFVESETQVVEPFNIVTLKLKIQDNKIIEITQE